MTMVLDVVFLSIRWVGVLTLRLFVHNNKGCYAFHSLIYETLIPLLSSDIIEAKIEEMTFKTTSGLKKYIYIKLNVTLILWKTNKTEKYNWNNLLSIVQGTVILTEIDVWLQSWMQSTEFTPSISLTSKLVN